MLDRIIYQWDVDELTNLILEINGDLWGRLPWLFHVLAYWCRVNGCSFDDDFDRAMCVLALQSVGKW